MKREKKKKKKKREGSRRGIDQLVLITKKRMTTTTMTNRSGRWLAVAAVAWLAVMSLQPEQAVAWEYWPFWSWGWPNWMDMNVDYMCYKEMYNRIAKFNPPGTSGIRKWAAALDACGFQRYTGGWWPIGFLEEDMRITEHGRSED